MRLSLRAGSSDPVDFPPCGPARARTKEKTHDQAENRLGNQAGQGAEPTQGIGEIHQHREQGNAVGKVMLS
eukprot:m.256907 g.256907  ORF g.256907 m.256907 type:complete len:71 (-) comp22830_c0_seq1:73-285(-)